jgi:mRNA interferase MazF
MTIRRGDIVLSNLEPVLGSEQGKIRPCLVVQNDSSNQFSPTTIIAPITSTIPDKKYPTLVIVEPEESGLKKESTILCGQIRTISVKHRVIKKLGTLKPGTMKKVDEALKTSLALD